jgi:hypothetical protein
MYQYSASLRDARLNAVVKIFGSSGATLKFFSGRLPLLCEDDDPPHLLATMQLPRQPFSDAKDGVVAAQGKWSATAVDVGRISAFRIYDANGRCHLQGAVGIAGQPAIDMVVDSDVVVPGQGIEVSRFAIVGAAGPTTDKRATTTIDDDDVAETLGQGIHKFARALNEKLVADGEAVRTERTAYGDLMRRALNQNRS